MGDKIKSIFKPKPEPSLDETTALTSREPVLLNALLRIVDAPVAAIAKFQINRGQFEPKPKDLEDIKHPVYYDLSLEPRMMGEDDKLGTWITKYDENRPTVVVFHGNTGHWGDLGIPKPVTDKGMMGKIYESERPEELDSRDYRLNLLHELKAQDVNIIAVHPPGFGLSHKLKPSEESYQEANAEVIRFLQEANIKGEDVVVMGESLGGSQATMFATQMTVEGMPPKTLSLVATPADFVRASADFAKFTPVGNYVAGVIERNPNIVKNPFDSELLLHQLDPEATSILIQQPSMDWVVQRHNSGMIKAEAERLGIPVTALMINGGHTTRDAEVVVKNTMDVHQDREPSSHKADAAIRPDVLPFSERVDVGVILGR